MDVLDAINFVVLPVLVLLLIGDVDGELPYVFLRIESLLKVSLDAVDAELMDFLEDWWSCVTEEGGERLLCTALLLILLVLILLEYS